MITAIQPLHAGNALRLFLQPPAGAVRWKVLRKGSGVFSGIADTSAIVAYDGDETVFVDIAFLQNEVMAYYAPFYTADGATWTVGTVASGTPHADYEDQTTDVMSFLRDRLEAGLKVEVERGNLINDLGHIQVYTATPSLERDLRMPLVTVHLENEEPVDRGIGEMLSIDEAGLDGIGIDEAEGWLANVSVTVIGWSLNGDERSELRKAIRRIVIANFPVFDSLGWLTPSLTQQDIDAVSGEYPAPMYQVMSTFTCVAPVRVSGVVEPVRDVISRSISNG